MAKRAARKTTDNSDRTGPTRGQMSARSLTVPDAQASSPYAPPQIRVTFAGDNPNSRGIVRGRGADWFGPLDPMLPLAPPDVAGRRFDFPTGYNLNIAPRSYEPVSFIDLRNLAETYDVLRLVIETRKDQMERLKWTIRPRDESKAAEDEPDCARITEFFSRPDGENDFGTWFRIVLEDLFVLDAPALYRRRDRLGRLAALEPIDGASIKRVLDDWGRTPQPFVAEDGTLVTPPAYQQRLKGFPAVDYTTDDLIYRPRNMRTHKVYGFGPVEQIIMTVNIGLRRQISTLQYYTEGNIPEALIGVPDNWTPEQIIAFQAGWDAMMEGNTAQRRHAKFVPGGAAKGYTPTREPELKNIMDEWLARVACFAFSISPQPFVIQMNRATAETAQQAALEEGLEPTMMWAKGLFDHVIRTDFKRPDLEWAYVEDQEIDQEKQTELLVARVGSGLMTLDEARADLGADGYGLPGVSDVPLIKTTNGYKLIDEESVGPAPPPPPPALAGALGPDGKPLPPKPGEPPPAATAGGGKGPPKDKAEKRDKTLKPISDERPAAAEARDRYHKRVNEILARALKEVSKQLPAELKRDAGRQHEA